MNYVKTQRKQTESFWKNHQWFVQAFESGIMDHNLTIKSDLIGGIALFTGRGLLLSSDVAQVVAAIGAILATATAYVQRIDATLLLGISLGFRVIDFNRRDFFDIVTKHPSMEVSR
jgi:urea transporter